MKLPICSLSSPACMVVYAFIYVNNNYSVYPSSFHVSKGKVKGLFTYKEVEYMSSYKTKHQHHVCIVYCDKHVSLPTCKFNVTWRYRDFFVTLRTFMNKQ